MALLDLPVDLLTYFPHWKKGSQQDFSPPASGIVPPAIGADEPFRLLRLQLSPFSTTLSAALLLLRRLIESLEEEAHFQVAVEPGGNLEMLQKIISGFHPSAGQRVELYELQTSSIFAQDNARGAVRTATGQSVVMIPRFFRQERERARDDLSSQLQECIGQTEIFRSALYWEGGNITHDKNHLFIGADTIQENISRLGITREQVLLLFQQEFGRQVCVLGDTSKSSIQANEFRSFTTGQASFHIDLDMCPLGNIHPEQPPTILLACPELALPVAAQILEMKKLISEHYLDEAEARKLIEFEYRTYAEKRIQDLSTYKRTLLDLDYRVIDAPDLRIDPDHNLFSTRNLDFIYCNVLSGKLRGEPSILYLPYGVPLLDELAAQSFEAAGCVARPLSKSGRLANLLMLFRGGLRCACSQLC